MFDQLIWYFCLAFSSACACAGQQLPHAGGRPGPCLPLHPGPAGSQAWLQPGAAAVPPAAALHLRLVQVATSAQSLAKHQHMLLPAVLRAEKTKHVAPCPVQTAETRGSAAFCYNCPSYAAAAFCLPCKRSPCTAVTRGSVMAPTLPAPWLLKAKLAVTPIFVPTSVPFLHTAGSFWWRNGTRWDVAARLSGLTPCPTPPAALAPGQPLGEGE